MADEVLKEIKYQGHKVVTEVARRDALGRTIDETYATKNELNDNQQRISELESTTYIYDGTVDEFIDDFFAANNINNGNYISKNNKVSALIRNSQNHGEFLKYNYYLSQGSHTIIYEDGEIQETFNVEEDGNYDVYFRPEGNASWGGSKVYIVKSNSSNLIRARSVLSNYTLRGTFNNWEALQMYETETQAIYWGIFLRNGDEFKIEHDGNWYPAENNYVINSTSYFDIYFNKDDNTIGIDNSAFAPFYIDKIALGFRAYVNLGIAMIYNSDGITKIYADAGGNRHIEKINDFVFNDDGLIHKDNLTTAIQTSLAKADTAVQPGTLNNYSLLIDAAHTLELTINSSNYVMSAVLKNKNGEILSSQSIDLPLETMIISASYDNDTKTIVLTLQSGSTITVPIGDLVDGLVSQSSFDSLESDVNLIDERLTVVETTIADTRIGITSQYVSQPSDVKEGSNIYINAKLRDSVNLLDIANSTVTKFSDRTTVTKNDNGTITLKFVQVNSGNASDYARIETTPSSLGLQVGDTITFSAICNISTPNLNWQAQILFYNQNYEQLAGGVTGFANNGNRAKSTATIPEGTTIIYLTLGKVYDKTVSINTTFNFSQIQLQKGNVATAYEPFGAYSKGKVMQYASKNILNLPSCTEVSISSLLGSYATSLVSDGTKNQIQIANNGFNNGTTRWIETKQNHNYFLFLNISNNSKTLRTSSDALYVNSLQNDGDNYYAKIESSVDTTCYLSILTTDRTNFESGTTFNFAVLIDLTLIGQHNLTANEAYDKYSSIVKGLALGESVANNVYQSPLIKVFSKELYLTKSPYYRFVLYEFKENPPFLNEDVSLDNLTLIKATTYSSSSQIELDQQTNSVMYFVYTLNYRPVSQEELAAWQMTDQLEYGYEATEHSDYIAPIEIGTFDKSVDGNEKTFSFVVLGTENQNIGFIPTSENDISIDFASSASDFTKSTFAYISTNLANQVAELESRVSGLETEVFELQESVATINTEMETMQGSITSNSQNINKIENDITSLEQDVLSLQQDITETKADITTINATLGTLPYSVELTINSSTYVVTLNLKNAQGSVISTQSIDLPLESVVVGGSYDETSKSVILTLNNGQKITIPIGDLVDGLVSQSDFNNLSSQVNTNTANISKVEQRRHMYPRKWKSKLLRFQAKSIVTNRGEIALNFLDNGGQLSEYHVAPYGNVDKSKANALLNQDLDFTMVFAAGHQHRTQHGIRKMGDKWGFSVNGAYTPRTFTLNSATKSSITLPELAQKVLKLIDPNCVINASNIELTNMPAWWRFPYVDNSTYQNSYQSPQNPKGDGIYPYRAYKINFNSDGLFDLAALRKSYNQLGTTEKERVLNNYFNAYCKKIFSRRWLRFFHNKSETGDSLHKHYPLLRLEIGFVHNFNLRVCYPNSDVPLYPNEFGIVDHTGLLSNKKWTGKLQKIYVELFMKFDNSNLDATMTTNNQADCCYVWWQIHCRK